MSELLLMRLGCHPDAPIDWLIWDRDAACPKDSGCLADADALHELASASGIRACYALLPQEQILLTEVRLPNARRATLGAIPYQLEERLCDDPAQLHFAVGRPGVDNRYPVAVVARALIQDWRDRLVGAAIEVDALFADAQCLQPDPDRLQILAQDARLVVSGAGGTAMAVPRSEFESWRPLLEDQGALDPLLPVPGAPPLTLLAPRLALEHGIDLLQGDYRLRRETSPLRRWRTPALLALALLLLHFAGLGLDHYRLSQRQAELDNDIAEQFRSALPEVRRMVNPRVQLGSRLDELRQRRQGPPFLRLLQQTVPAFERNPDVRLKGLTFDRTHPTLRLRLEADTAAALQRFAASLADAKSSEPRLRGAVNVIEITLEDSTR